MLVTDPHYLVNRWKAKSLLGMFLNLSAAVSVCEHIHIWVFEEENAVRNEVKLGFSSQVSSSK